MRQFIDPLWPILALLISTGLSVSKVKPHIAKYLRRIGIGSLILLVFLSTNVATLIFDKILAAETTQNSTWSPKYILVLGGGYEVGAVSAQDFLNTESTRRVNQAVTIWRKYPTAILVMSGNQTVTDPARAATRHGELARDRAIALGVPTGQIQVESRSSNTHEHPIEALAIDGFTRDTTIAIVTSNFHLRRSLIEFQRYFLNVSSFGSDTKRGGFSWISFIPLSEYLSDNSARIKEFVGIIVFAIRSV